MVIVHDEMIVNDEDNGDMFLIILIFFVFFIDSC